MLHYVIDSDLFDLFIII